MGDFIYAKGGLMSEVVFSYKARNAQGIETSGTIQAASKEDALKKIQELKDSGLQNISIENASASTKKCPQCAEEVQVEAVKCKHCSASLTENRSDIEKKIDGYLKRGFVVQFKDERRIQLFKKKKFSLFWAVAWACLALVGIFVYIIYYIAKRDEVVTLNL